MFLGFRSLVAVSYKLVVLGILEKAVTAGFEGAKAVVDKDITSPRPARNICVVFMLKAVINEFCNGVCDLFSPVLRLNGDGFFDELRLRIISLLSRIVGL